MEVRSLRAGNEQVGAIAFEREGANDGGSIGKAGRMAYDSAGNKDLLYGRQGGVCVGCRLRFPQRNMTVDHIRPQSMGGGHGIGNLQLLCAACNSLKGAGSHEALIAKLLEAGVIVLTRRGKYAPVGGRGSTMGPVAIAVLVAVIPHAVDGVAKAVKKYGPGLADAAKKYRPVLAERAGSAGHAVADGAGSAGRTVTDGARGTGRMVADGAGSAGRTVTDGARGAGRTVTDGARGTGRMVADGAGSAGHAVADGARSAGHAVADGADRARERARRWRGQGAEADGEAPPEKDREPL